MRKRNESKECSEGASGGGQESRAGEETARRSATEGGNGKKEANAMARKQQRQQGAGTGWNKRLAGGAGRRSKKIEAESGDARKKTVTHSG